ncbi:LuxR family transcriptional regulator [Longispora sp. K20-0274]|uniref:LuxR family transcriptional regulator n=1 Tax=Longispora sp. K20-0274 TaxID=3088255 RepID=UPI00399BBC3D
MNRPRYVVGTGADATTVLRRLAREGWRTRESFALPEAAWDVSDARLVLFGRISDVETVRLAVLAAARGAGVVAVIECESDLGRALLADLSRVGPVVRGVEDGTSDALPLSEEQCQLLERLANGETIAAAAAAEYLSLRTANRRIAQARDALGVATTREAVLSYIRRRRR